MNEEKVPGAKKEEKGPKWLLIIIGVIVVVAIVAAWQMTREKTSSTTVEETKTVATVKEPKHADWQKFTSSKYGFTMYYPTEYTLAESAVGTVILSKGSTEMVDLYVTVASTSGDPVASAIAPYMDDTKGYMTSAAEVDTTAAGIEATMVNGIMGPKAAINPHTGIKGGTIFFVKNGNLFALDSFYNDNVEDFQIFEDILADIRF